MKLAPFTELIMDKPSLGMLFKLKCQENHSSWFDFYLDIILSLAKIIPSSYLGEEKLQMIKLWIATNLVNLTSSALSFILYRLRMTIDHETEGAVFLFQ